MPSYCCVPGCTNSGGHLFPKEEKLRLKWRVAIKRSDHRKGLWKPGDHDVVCHDHFLPTDYTETLLGERGRLKKEAVPSVFSYKKLDNIENNSARSVRLQTRRKSSDAFFETNSEQSDCFHNSDVQYETEIEGTAFMSSACAADENQSDGEIDAGIQCELIGKFSIDNMLDEPKKVMYYTGFSNYDHFMFFFQCLGPAAHDLNYKCSSLSPQDQLFLTIMKLRCAKEDIELSFFFGISESTVSRVIVTWINFLYFQLQELDIWPSREVVDEYMPVDFLYKFPSTRIILDATEIPIQKPSNVNAQSITWSSYKHKNTVKCMVGCTPRGAVSYVSDTYGGSTSDRQIIEQSSLLQDASQQTFSSGDSIMADRGIMVQDLFAHKDVYVNTPTMLKGKSQLEPEEIVRDRRVASKRIHIERVIGLSKRFKILKTELPPSKLHLSNRIIYVCFALLNFKKCIVDRFA